MLKYCKIHIVAPVAQRIEQVGSNDKVGGSIPSGRTTLRSVQAHGGRSSMVRASACGAESCGFESRRPPTLLLNLFRVEEFFIF